uniref:Uncharacterized protein n=1 Tax=Chromera velia CCMP2878 TaxID=1169474 RepID=A0A0G4GHV7_9ALVE|eukprot:Cvel_659.t1-p1 / transcript=Cvel_659.t1 / gene=Cvel_659 / organism=Chromera_velia_CCMP2878 / gene_product=hypothetical protein / transcript_product=hypothetical protein / location=Cvel_scaffold20:107096-107395(-) / protein_length=100 / sequence_SO=supercontig / SO=protein_coding / is_pseudo=false
MLYGGGPGACWGAILCSPAEEEAGAGLQVLRGGEEPAGGPGCRGGQDLGGHVDAADGQGEGVQGLVGQVEELDGEGGKNEGQTLVGAGGPEREGGALGQH